MTPDEIAKLRRDLFEGDHDARSRAGYACAKSGDSTLMNAAFEFIDRADPETSTIRIIDGFIDGGSATIDALIEHVLATPSSQSGKDAAFALGEIAYKQRPVPDPRLARAAADFFDRGFPHHLELQGHAVYIYRQLVWSAPVPEATDRLRRYADLILGTVQPDYGLLKLAWDTLLENIGSSLLDELRTRRDALAPEHPLRVHLIDYLEGKARGEAFS